MIRPIREALFIGAILLALPAAAATLEDDDGNVIELENASPRIVTLAPHLAELVFAVGAGDQLVGTIEWSDYPKAALEVPRIGDAFRVDFERIIDLQPDVVLAWGGGTPLEVVDQLRKYGIAVAVVRPTKLSSISGHLRWLGELSGHLHEGEQQAAAFESRLHKLRRNYSGREEVRVFYQISARPLYTINAHHPISELISLCGGRNIFSDLDRLAPAVTLEAVLGRNPQAIVAGRYDDGDGGLDAWKKWQDIDAVRFDNLITVDAATLARSTPRILEGGEDLCRKIDMARNRIE